MAAADNSIPANQLKYGGGEWKIAKEYDVEIARLSRGNKIMVEGTLDTQGLRSDTLHSVVFSIKMENSASGWDAPVTMTLTLPNGDMQQHQEHLDAQKQGEWIYIPVGMFNTYCVAGRLQASMSASDDTTKKGLVIKNLKTLAIPVKE